MQQIILRSVAWLDHKNTAIVTWYNDRTADIDCSIFWSSSYCTALEHFMWLYFHIMTVFPTTSNYLVSKVESTTRPLCIIRCLNAQYISSFMFNAILRFEWSALSGFPCMCKFDLVFPVQYPTPIRSFASRLAAIFVLHLLPAWKIHERPTSSSSSSSTKIRFGDLVAETNEIANNAILYMVTLPALAVEILAELEAFYPNNRFIDRVFPLIKNFLHQGTNRPVFHYFLLLHEFVDVVLDRPPSSDVI